MPILPLTEENFEQEVPAGRGAGARRPLCRVVRPVPCACAGAGRTGRGRPELRIGKVDVDAQPELAARFDVLTVPTLLLFRSGRLFRRTTGAKTPAELEEFLRSGEA